MAITTSTRPARCYRLPARRVDEVLGRVGLTEVARKRLGGFSLGMSQRLGIAAALLGLPSNAGSAFTSVTTTPDLLDPTPAALVLLAWIAVPLAAAAAAFVGGGSSGGSYMRLCR